jgi:homogentisate 1,2-dioxygenase
VATGHSEFKVDEADLTAAKFEPISMRRRPTKFIDAVLRLAFEGARRD